MAVTKIHPIKSTLKSALDYIMNADKTDHEILISSYACGHQTAYLEFENTKNSWNSTVKNLARHLIQSFDPEDDITPEVAHEIGLKLAEEILNNKYEFVISTHVDKGHIHNHILWNNLSYEDGKAYISNKRTYRKIREASDNLCLEYNLHVIDGESKIKGKSYKELQETKKGTSWKSQLKYAVDNAVKRANDWEDFLRIMQQMGYEIKEGKYISFRAKDQTRFTRSKTIGDYYTEEKIKERINNRQKQRAYKYSKELSVEKIIDIKNNEKAKIIKGYEIWAKQHNLKNIAKTLRVMNELNIVTVDDLYKSSKEQNMDLTLQSRKIKDIENKVNQLAKRGKDLQTYKNYYELYEDYQNSSDKGEFYRANTDKIILFEAAKNALGDSFELSELEDISLIKNELQKLKYEKNVEAEKYRKQKNKVSELNLLRTNLETYMEWQEPVIEEKREH
ncbi:relaxase/mobilization nuclease domain-containing protein [Gudongella sp. SC589]|uniref:relaxase/mobilization nuclease domain-containing protein n=1 Tax=Gudongella sp. SC589 TaxID=3385990 RepID=UPI003904B6F0